MGLKSTEVTRAEYLDKSEKDANDGTVAFLGYIHYCCVSGYVVR